MAVLGMDEELLKSDWARMCTGCQRCIYVCPMKIDLPQLVYEMVPLWKILHLAGANWTKPSYGYDRP